MTAPSARVTAAWLWKIPVVAGSYFVATMISGAVVTAAGLKFPEFPGQTYAPALSLLASLFLATAVLLLARGIRGATWARWLMLFAFTYVCYCVNNQIEGATFTTLGGQSTLLLFFLLPSAIIAAVAALLAKPPESAEPLATVFAKHPATSWLWRTVLAWLAFPAIYFFFGMFAYPFVADSYEVGELGLVVPNLGVIAGVASLRSLLFLLVTVPILMNWARSRSSLLLALAVAFSSMVGVAGLIEAAWFPTTMRVVHSIEIIADSVVYAWVLLALLMPTAAAVSRRTPSAKAI